MNRKTWLRSTQELNWQAACAVVLGAVVFGACDVVTTPPEKLKPAAVNDRASFNELSSRELGVLANDIDPDNPPPAPEEFYKENPNDPSTFYTSTDQMDLKVVSPLDILNSNGTFVDNPGLSSGDSFEYTIEDTNNGKEATATVTIE